MECEGPPKTITKNWVLEAPLLDTIKGLIRNEENFELKAIVSWIHKGENRDN